MKEEMTVKILVHLHLYYNNQVDYIISKLKNICDCDWDLVVTYVNDDSKCHEKIKQLKQDAKFIKVENLGYDILPFLKLIKDVNLDEYDYVLKIHTKNERNILFSNNSKIPKLYLKDFEWRNLLFDALLSSKKRFRCNLKKISDHHIGFIGNGILCFDIRKSNNTDSNSLLKELKNKLNVSTDYNYFIAGTMFLIKASILNRLKCVDLDDERLYVYPQTGNCGTYLHAFERIFTILTIDEGYKVYWVKDYLNGIKYLFRYIVPKIFP